MHYSKLVDPEATKRNIKCLPIGRCCLFFLFLLLSGCLETDMPLFFTCSVINLVLAFLITLATLNLDSHSSRAWK